MREWWRSWSGSPTLRVLFWLSVLPMIGAFCTLAYALLLEPRVATEADDPTGLMLIVLGGVAVSLLFLTVGSVIQWRQAVRRRAEDPAYVPSTPAERAGAVFAWAAASPAILWMSYVFTAAKGVDLAERPPHPIMWVLTALTLIAATVSGLVWRRLARRERALGEAR